MIIKTLFDKTARDENFHTGWGISFLIDERLIFDTGEKGPWLMKNIEKLNVDLNRVEAIVISHDHWDHWGGLWDLLRAGKCKKIYSCKNFGDEFKYRSKELGAQLVETVDFEEIFENFYLSGQMDGLFENSYIAEQSLIIRTQNGINIITGCAHPGILKIVEKVRNKFNAEEIYSITGGFHLMDDDSNEIELVAQNLKNTGIKKIYPTHCSGDKAAAIFREKFGDGFGEVIVGENITI